MRRTTLLAGVASVAKSSQAIDEVEIIRDLLVGAGVMSSNVAAMTVSEMRAYVRGRMQM